MPEATQHVFTHKEVAEALVEKLGIKEGIWGLYFEFGIVGANMGPDPDGVLPAAVVPVMKIGVQRMPELSNIAIDAAMIGKRQAPLENKPEKERTKRRK